MYDQEIQQGFWSKVNKTDTCWLWTGRIDKDGYGTFKINDKQVAVHRFSYELESGSPGNLIVRHTCNTRICVNPSHLYLAVWGSWSKVDRYTDLDEQFCISNNLIPLTQGKYATVDNIDFEYLSQFNWCYSAPYVCRSHKPLILIHREVMQRKLGRPLTRNDKVDHEDRNPLNNTRNNLRLATYSQNAMNRKKRANSVSQFKGVTKCRASWQATITVNGHILRLGSFEYEKEAARAYDQHALLWFREFANLNFPDEWLELTNRLTLKIRNP